MLYLQTTMADDVIEVNTLRDYGQEQWPLLVRGGALDSWPCLHWTLTDWADRIDQETALTFRVHPRFTTDRIAWENEALDYVEAYLSELIQHMDQSQVLSDRQSESGRDTNNPFREYSMQDYCFYTSYNHMKKLFSPESDVVTSVQWHETGLGEPKLRNDALESTLWIGTKNASTPCHQDSYGYNFVAQLYGK